MPTSVSPIRRSRRMLYAALAALAAGLCLTAVPAVARADTVGTLFEAPGFAPGDINAQAGWMNTGHFDAAVVTNTAAAAPAFGPQSLRISNATASGSFGDQTLSPALFDGAGETTSATGGVAGGVRQGHLDLALRFGSAAAVPAAEQPGLAVTVSPDSGAGARMSFLRLKDLPGGLAVDFVDVPSPATDALGHVDFPATPVAAGLDRTVAHSVRLAIDFVAGEDNDVVSVFVDDQLRFTGTTWENYYRHDVEAASLSNVVPVVDQMLLRVNTPGPAALQAHGFLIDDVNLRSSASAAAGAAGGVSVIPGATGATGVTGPTGATGALPRATVVCSGQTVRVLRAPNRHGERLLSARATLRGRALKVNGRRISVDLRARTAGSYRVQITSRYRKGGATAIRTVRSTRTLTVRCV